MNSSSLCLIDLEALIIPNSSMTQLHLSLSQMYSFMYPNLVQSSLGSGLSPISKSLVMCIVYGFLVVVRGPEYMPTTSPDRIGGVDLGVLANSPSSSQIVDGFAMERSRRYCSD